jgi:hypothetical protein
MECKKYILVVTDVSLESYRLLWAERRGPQIFKKSRSNLNVTVAEKGDMKQIAQWGPNRLGTTVQNSVARATWRPEFVRL